MMHHSPRRSPRLNEGQNIAPQADGSVLAPQPSQAGGRGSEAPASSAQLAASGATRKPKVADLMDRIAELEKELERARSANMERTGPVISSEVGVGQPPFSTGLTVPNATSVYYAASERPPPWSGSQTHQKKMSRISQLSQEQRRQAALNRSRARYEQNASQIRVRNSEHIANVRANNPELREESRAREATARATWRRSERIRNIERIRDAEGHAHRRQDPEERRREQVQDTAHHATRRTDPEFRSRERIRDMEARANRREDPQERRREQVQDTAHHATRRTDLEYRIPERIRDMEARSHKGTWTQEQPFLRMRWNRNGNYSVIGFDHRRGIFITGT
ncbi:uncharacterized protein Dana_GF26849 [Drosophila ananassae]|uniref:Uncharacterized protein n=1 Tax=Drosophila ananassae TaxID=7217 RepID=A0A0P9C669_DROAN|nr:uncharacterized protein Dana_GF26849 [Drosophila ananassae]